MSEDGNIHRSVSTSALFRRMHNLCAVYLEKMRMTYLIAENF